MIDPRTSLWISYWDLVTTFCLLFTALVTPFEVRRASASRHVARRRPALHALT